MSLRQIEFAQSVSLLCELAAASTIQNNHTSKVNGCPELANVPKLLNVWMWVSVAADRPGEH